MGVGRWAVRAASTVEGVASAYAAGDGAIGGARDAIAGIGGLRHMGDRARHAAYRARAVRGAPGTHAGGEFFHDDADRLVVLDRLDASFAAFRAEIEPVVTAPGATEARTQWWTTDVLPAIQEWQRFRERESSWLARFATEWSEYGQWLTRLRTMRADARVQGIALRSPEPAPIPRTLFERGATGLGSRADTVWTTGRVLLYAALGITGVLALRTAFRDLKDLRGQREESAADDT